MLYYNVTYKLYTMKKLIVISDVDGCLTDGKFICTVDGKVAKIFGAHDNDGIKLLRKNDIDVRFISADKPGFEITKKRINHMKCDVEFVSEADRGDYLLKWTNDYHVIFFGDGLGDLAAYFKVCKAAPEDISFIAPANARWQVHEHAHFITDNIGGEGAFLDLAEIVISNMVVNPKQLYQLEE